MNCVRKGALRCYSRINKLSKLSYDLHVGGHIATFKLLVSYLCIEGCASLRSKWLGLGESMGTHITEAAEGSSVWGQSKATIIIIATVVFDHLP